MNSAASRLRDKVMVHVDSLFSHLYGEDVRRCPCPMFKVQKFPVEELIDLWGNANITISWELDLAHRWILFLSLDFFFFRGMFMSDQR